MSVQIARATAADEDVCREFDPRISEAMIARKIAAGELLLARRDSEAVGYLRLEYLWSKLPFIGLIEVGVAHRNQGVGRALLKFVEEHVRRSGQRRLLSSSMVDQMHAQAWHRRMGFAECGFLSGVNTDGIGEVFFVKEVSG